MATLKLIGCEGELLSGSYSYFWGKTVEGFNPEEHCAKCLVGRYIDSVSTNLCGGDEIELDVVDGELVYVCGVSKPYVWRNNFHLAIQIGGSESLQVKLYNGMLLEVVGAKRVMFTGTRARKLFPEKKKAFLTCRNFQFAAQLFGRPGVEVPKRQMYLF